MEVCSENHEEIVFHGIRRCPVCDLVEELQETIRDLHLEIGGLERELHEAGEL